MGDVKRHNFFICGLGTDFVLASDFDAALAALREELAASRKNTEFARESMQVFAGEADSLQQRLTAECGAGRVA